jgi:IMP dehydrogenase
MPKTKRKPVYRSDAFFKRLKRENRSITFDDTLLRPNRSNVLPRDASVATNFSRRIRLNNPILSAAMDTVTESKTAIAMALNGGLGIIHKAMTPEEQGKMVTKVKYYLNALIPDPITVNENDTIKNVEKMIKDKGYTFSSFPVINDRGKVIGIVADRDFRRGKRNRKEKIHEIMSTDLQSAPFGISVEEAYEYLNQSGKSILPLFDKKKEFRGIYTRKDVERILDQENNGSGYSLDASGRLLVGAAVGAGDMNDLKIRMKILSKAKVDIVVVDSAHGDTTNVLRAIRFIKKNYHHIDIMAGNVTEPAAAKRLARAGADVVKVGIGGGSICTTRKEAGSGCPQLTAIFECAFALRHTGVTICADGGIKYSGDMVQALAAGANTIMVGSLIAGTDEAPGEKTQIQGRTVKLYRGMGSLEAMKDNAASRERYGQLDNSNDKLVPEGISGYVDYKGPIADVLIQYIGGIQAGMGYNGAKDILTLQKNAHFTLITPAGQKESHPHNILFMKAAPNYPA